MICDARTCFLREVCLRAIEDLGKEEFEWKLIGEHKNHISCDGFIKK